MPAVRSAATKRSLTFINTLLVTTAFTVPAFAQIETVVVTAEKRAEDLQTVPVAVTAITGDELKKKEISTFKDLQFNVPNVTYYKGSLGSGVVSIRGIGQAAGDPGISQYQNGVFTEDNDLATASYYDLKDIEVLRGPQGTLYGRASVGGLINTYTATPDFDALAANADFTYGTYDTIKATGVLNIPITDNLAVRFAGAYDGHSGFIKNLAPGFANPDSNNTYSGRASVRWQPDADTTIDVVGSYTNEADSRDRIDGILCHTDPTGVIGCLPDKLAFQPINSLGNAIGVLDSKQWLSTIGGEVGQGVAAGSIGVAPTGVAFTAGQIAAAGGAIAGLAGFGDLTPAQATALNGLLAGTDNLAAFQAVFGGIAAGYATAGGRAGIFDLSQADGSLGTGTSPTIQSEMPKKLGEVNNPNNSKFDEFQPTLSFHLNHKLNDWLTTDVIAGYSAGVRHSVGPYSYFPTEQYNDAAYANSFTTDGGFGASLANLLCNNDTVGSHCNPVDNLAEFSLLTGNSATRVGNLLADYFPNNSTTGQAQLFPLSNFNPGGIALLPGTPGASGAGIKSFVTGNSADDQEVSHGRETSVEWRFSSNLSGPFNFTAGAFFYDRRNYNEPYRVTFNGGDYWSLFEGAAFLGSAPSAGDQPYVGVDPYYYQDVTTTSSSKAVYFDGTYDLTDDLVFKGGLRWQEDRDHLINDHLSFTALNSPASCPAQVAVFCNIAASSSAAAVLPTAIADEHVGTSTNPDTTDRVNGRAVLQWSPKLDFTDQTMVYASYSRGSKAGNVNLISGVAAAEGVPTTFKPEDLTSYEIGTKNTLFDGTLQANLTAWYYQYQNFQYTVVQFSTLFTQNFNAHMWGEEGEFIWQPTEDFTMNLNVTNSSSSIAGGQFAADARNPTAGVANAVLIKDDTLSGSDFPGGNCVLLEHTGEDPASDPQVTAYYAAQGLPNAFVAPVAAVGGPTALASNHIAFANFGTCSADMSGVPVTDPTGAKSLNTFLDTLNATPGKIYYEYTNASNAGPGSSVSGIAVPLQGKQVLNLPTNTVSVGAQYMFHFDEFSLVPRVDYYWTSSYFSRIFNDNTDKVPSWDQWNASIQLNAPDSRWYAKVYATNIGGKRNPEGFAPQSDTSGVPTYVATEDPRIIGFTIGARY